MGQIVTNENFSLQEYPPGKRRALLINPPVYDAQYWARWSQPAGLLRIATLLKRKGYDLTLVDCMETDALGMVPKRQRREGGSHTQSVVRRDNIQKPIYHFGMPIERFKQQLATL